MWAWAGCESTCTQGVGGDVDNVLSDVSDANLWPADRRLNSSPSLPVPGGLKTKTALKQETNNLSDLKHDPHCGFVELGDSVSVSL